MITLPTSPAPVAAAPYIVDFGGFLTPGLGGEVQRLDRMGNRFGIAVTMPPLESEEDGRILVGRLIRGKTEGVLTQFPLLSFDPGSPGAPLVNGTGQSGKSLICDGFTAGYTIKEGQWFSLIHGGRRYLHNVDAQVAANGSGQATLTISPMLRIEPANNAVLEFAQPMIEGFIHGEEWRWQMSLEHLIGIEFEVRERA